MVTIFGKAEVETLCRSCDTGFVVDLEAEDRNVSTCRRCRSLCSQVESSLRRFNPRELGSVAKKLFFAAVTAKTNGKFVRAQELIVELSEQSSSDRIEAANRKVRKMAKKERWRARQSERRSHDQEMAHGGKRK